MTSVRQRMAQVGPDRIAVSTITVMEIEYGLARQPKARRRYGQLWAEFRETTKEVVFDAAGAVETALIRQELARARTPIGPYDLQLAGTARSHGFDFVTNNVAEFRRVDRLTALDWRDS